MVNPGQGRPGPLPVGNNRVLIPLQLGGRMSASPYAGRRKAGSAGSRSYQLIRLCSVACLVLWRLAREPINWNNSEH